MLINFRVRHKNIDSGIPGVLQRRAFKKRIFDRKKSSVSIAFRFQMCIRDSFYLELGYDGLLTTIFVLTFGVSNIVVQSFYPFLSRKLGRRRLLKYSFYLLGLGYLLFLLMGFIPVLPVHIVTVCLFGAMAFAGQSIFYMILTIGITNTVEYNEYKTDVYKRQ